MAPNPINDDEFAIRSQFVPRSQGPCKNCPEMLHKRLRVTLSVHAIRAGRARDEFLRGHRGNHRGIRRQHPRVNSSRLQLYRTRLVKVPPVLSIPDSTLSRRVGSRGAWPGALASTPLRSSIRSTSTRSWTRWALRWGRSSSAMRAVSRKGEVRGGVYSEVVCTKLSIKEILHLAYTKTPPSRAKNHARLRTVYLLMPPGSKTRRHRVPTESCVRPLTPHSAPSLRTPLLHNLKQMRTLSSTI